MNDEDSPGGECRAIASIDNKNSSANLIQQQAVLISLSPLAVCILLIDIFALTHSS